MFASDSWAALAAGAAPETITCGILGWRLVALVTGEIVAPLPLKFVDRASALRPGHRGRRVPTPSTMRTPACKQKPPYTSSPTLWRAPPTRSSSVSRRSQWTSPAFPSSSSTQAEEDDDTPHGTPLGKYLVPAPCAATCRQAGDQGMNSRSHRNLQVGSGLRELEGFKSVDFENYIGVSQQKRGGI